MVVVVLPHRVDVHECSEQVFFEYDLRIRVLQMLVTKYPLTAGLFLVINYMLDISPETLVNFSDPIDLIGISLISFDISLYDNFFASFKIITT